MFLELPWQMEQMLGSLEGADSKRLSRRDFFKGTLVAGSIALMGCVTQPPPLEIITDVDIIRRLFPQIVRYPILSSGDVRTTFNILRWYNLTTATVNTDPLGVLYSYFEQLGEEKRGYTPDLKNPPIFNPVRRIKDISLVYFIPESLDLYEDAAPAFTAYISAYGKMIAASFIKIFPQDDGSSNTGLTVESCQASLKVNAIPGQELVCNSVGFAFDRRQKNTSYSDYKANFHGVTMWGYPAIIVDEADYLKMPEIPQVINYKK